MTIFLQWIQGASTYIKLNPSTREYSLSPCPCPCRGDVGDAALSGIYDIFGDVLVAIYVSGSELLVRIGNRVISVVEGVVARIHNTKLVRRIEVLSGTGETVGLDYFVEIDPIFSGQYLYAVEAEDFDIGVLIFNILNDRQRIASVKRVWRHG